MVLEVLSSGLNDRANCLAAWANKVVSTRTAVDAGYIPSDVQVGQTGKIIADIGLVGDLFTVLPEIEALLD